VASPRFSLKVVVVFTVSNTTSAGTKIRANIPLEATTFEVVALVLERPVLLGSEKIWSRKSFQVRFKYWVQSEVPGAGWTGVVPVLDGAPVSGR
jgi:hypothetical protein